ncbi:amino acid ABC transporter permease, partial [Psychromonas aquatilis]
FKYIGNLKAKIPVILLFPVVCFILISGGFGLEDVETEKWGGLMLTILLAAVGIIASFPIGVVIALGLQSDMP